MDLLILLFIIMLLWAIQIAPKKNFFVHTMVYENTIDMKGILTVLVLFVFLSERTETGRIFQSTGYLGYLVAGIFYMLSGYGVMRKYLDKGESYLVKFLPKRIGQILIPYVLMNFIYAVVYYVIGESISFREVFASYRQGEPFVLLSWFAISIMIFYIGFYLCFKVFKQYKKSAMLALLVYTVAYVLICQTLKFDAMWYCVSGMFVVGILYGYFESSIYQTICKKYWSMLSISAGIGIVTFAGVVYMNSTGHVHQYTYLILQNISAVAIGASVIVLSFKIKFKSLLWGYLGRVSLVMYLIQGLFMRLLRNEQYYVRTDIVYAVTVIGLTVLVGSILYFVFLVILYFYDKLWEEV